MSEKVFTGLTLVLDNGTEITLSYPEDDAEEIWADLMEVKQWWYCGNWTNLSVSYCGYLLVHINMQRVVGIR